MSRKQARWSEPRSALTYDIQYKRGATNMADPLSQQPVGEPPGEEAVLMAVTRWSSGSPVARIKRAYATNLRFS